METEQKPGSDEDGSASREAAAAGAADCGPPPAGLAENPTSKRGFPESSRADADAGGVAEEDGGLHAAKRVKLAGAESPSQSPQPGEQRAPGAEAPDSADGGGAAQAAFPGDSSSVGRRPLQAFSPPGSVGTTDAVSVKTDPEEKPVQERAALGPDGDAPSPPQEAGVTCASGDTEVALRCPPCGHLIPSRSDLETLGDSGVRQAGGPGPQQAFSCDLCGFQCVEESLLDAHCLGKTHLRRQNLAARGGFVQILTKPPCPKKPCALGAKSVAAKARAKSAAKHGVSRGLQHAGAKCAALRGGPAEQGAGSSELLVEMTPSADPLPQRVELAEEHLAPGEVAGNLESPRTELGPLATSEGLLAQSPKHTPPSAHEAVATSKPRPERNIFLLGTGFRRRGGTFTLKGQAKKRFSLLGISKRGASETQRLFMKHLRTQMRGSDAQSAPRHVGVSGSVHGARGPSSAPQDPQRGGADAHRPCSMDSLTTGPASDRQPPRTGTDHGPPAASGMELDTRVSQGRVRDGEVSRQTCGLPRACVGALEERSLGTPRLQAAPVLSCPCCAFTVASEPSLRAHVREQHGAGFLCTLCDLRLSSEEDVEEHKAAESCRRLLGRAQPSQPPDSDPVFQTLPLGALSLGNTRSSPSEPGQAAQEESAPPRGSHGGEVRHLSRPQFQCKKCFYKTRSSSVLTRHVKLRHGQDYHFLCRACNLYSLSREGMEKHIKRSKHLENAKKNNIGLSFEECIERVCIGANDKKEELAVSASGRLEVPVGGVQPPEQPCAEKNRPTPRELPQPGAGSRAEGSAPGATPKRGRPKGNNVSRTCSHCGLLASSTTNLTVHIRRKHSHQYSYLCKVCKYYTVTKGDMERHCATKKHKGRVEVEAHGRQSSDIVVGPEGGNLEATRKSSSSAVTVSDEPPEPDTSTSGKPLVEQGSAAEVEVETVLPAVDGDIDGQVIARKGQVCLEPEDPTQQDGACAQRDAAGAGDNKCVHCEFSAHSAASLELHVKRRHTKEFAFYCMACEYYAVTPREMTRHAATEKHKAKRQSYLHSSGVEAGSAEVSGSILIPEEQHQQNCEEFEVIADPPPETLKSGAADCPVLEEPAGFPVPRVLCAPDAAAREAEGESGLGKDHPLCETAPQPLVREKAVNPEEMVSLNVPSSYSSPSEFQNEDSGTSASNYEKTAKAPPPLNDPAGPSLRGESDGGSPGGSRDTVRGTHVCPGVPAQEPPAESAGPVVVRATRGQEALEGAGQDGGGSAQASGGLKTVREDAALEHKAVLMNSQHDARIIEEDGPASDSTAESNDVYETIISIDEKGQAVYSFGRFDSSIIRIKNPEDSELMDHSEEGLVTGVRISEVPVKDAAQGVKKKKSESTSFGESSRIRCDDCGFLADGLSGLNVHIAMKHPTKEKHFHCLLCGKSFYTESNLHQHLASAGHMRNEQASVEELPEGGATFKCVKCTEPFDSEQNLFLHIKGQHEELLREVNKYIVEDTEQINREREENQGNVCKYCGKMCRSSNSMAFLAHIRTHTGSKPFKCKICHFATAQLGDARNHVKRHLGMREYKCHVC
ncbi:Zinc finger protein 407, partial [Galemys pyrenaicus]